MKHLKLYENYINESSHTRDEVIDIMLSFYGEDMDYTVFAYEYAIGMGFSNDEIMKELGSDEYFTSFCNRVAYTSFRREYQKFIEEYPSNFLENIIENQEDEVFDSIYEEGGIYMYVDLPEGDFEVEYAINKVEDFRDMFIDIIKQGIKMGVPEVIDGMSIEDTKSWLARIEKIDKYKGVIKF